MEEFTTGKAGIHPNSLFYILNNFPTDNIYYGGFNLRTLLKSTNEESVHFAGYCMRTHQFIFIKYINTRFRDDTDKCMICFDQLKNELCVKLSGCKHMMHYGCYKMLSKTYKKQHRETTCPMCRATTKTTKILTNVQYVRYYKLSRIQISQPSCWTSGKKYIGTLTPTSTVFNPVWKQKELLHMCINDRFPTEIINMLM